jgi:hypothetical protein
LGGEEGEALAELRRDYSNGNCEINNLQIGRRVYISATR